MYVTIVLFLLHAAITGHFYFLATKGYLTLTVVFHKGGNPIIADKSSSLVPSRCLLFLVTNGSLTLLFFILEQIVRTGWLLFLVMNGNLTLLFFIWK